MSLYLECLGESVLEKLRALHSTYDDTGYIRQVMGSLFGFPPSRCLVCAKPLYWENSARDVIPNDVDPWFCESCCPICESEIEYEAAR